LSVADKAGAGQGLAEARFAVSGSVRDTRVCVGVGERVKDAMGAGVGVNAGKAASECVNREEGDDLRIGVRVGGNEGRRKESLSKCLRDISRPVIRRPRLEVDGVAVGTPCSGVLPGAQWV
jgi:hypothetical protein